MPEMPELQAHAERLTADFAGRRLRRFTPLVFTALKTAVPAPDVAYGSPLETVGRRGKYLLLTFEPATFVVHLLSQVCNACHTRLRIRCRNDRPSTREGHLRRFQ